MRLPFIYKLSLIPSFIWYGLPLIMIYSLPLAATTALYTTIQQHHAYDQLLITAYLRAAKNALYRAFFLFGACLTVCFGLLVFDWAPQSYKTSKALLLKAAKDHFLQLQPHKFHTPFPTVTFYYRAKQPATANQAEQESIFHNILLIITPKGEGRYFFTAQKGYFTQHALVLEHGQLSTLKEMQCHQVNFEKTYLNIDHIIDAANTHKNTELSKFMGLRQLFRAAGLSHDLCAGEIHKRIAQIVWFMALLVIAVYLAFIAKGYGLVVCLLGCGVPYLISYFLLNLAQVFYPQQGVFFMVLYGPLVFLLLIYSLIYRINSWLT
jgi:lipopolysaccharide export LptBFGC system permease protein LptF